MVIVAVVFLLAALHLASTGFGLKKHLGVVIGVVAFAAGLVPTLGKGAKGDAVKKSEITVFNKIIEVSGRHIYSPEVECQFEQWRLKW